MSLAELLNHDPSVFAVDGAKLFATSVAHLGPQGTAPPVAVANAPLFINAEILDEIREAIQSILRVVALPSYRKHCSCNAPELGHMATPALGVFYGFDFHIGPDGPRLIEINTNAGGAMLLARIQEATYLQLSELQKLPLAPGWPSHGTERLIQTFTREFARVFPERPLRSVAIVDHEPCLQYLYTEFLLFQAALRAAGYHTEILAPNQLEWQAGGITHQGRHVDLLYNRLVDFNLEDPRHAVLAQAATESTTVLTPAPVHHALFADKRRLALLCNPEALTSLGASVNDAARLARVIPVTRVVQPDTPGITWQDRKPWFFKPWAGYGSRAAYRGDKLTRATFEHISLEGGYVAQQIVPPSRRVIATTHGTSELAADIRAFVCDEEVLLFGARLYRGQTTNMRTEGGGFAAVIPLLESKASGF